MDFVVLGFGVGALLVLVGLGVRDLGPMLRRLPRPGLADLPWSEVARRVAWGRACRAAGLVVTLAGAALCLVTLLVLVAGAGDGLGMGLVLGMLATTVLVSAGWALLFVRQVQPERARTGRLAGAVRDLGRRPVGATAAVPPSGAGSKKRGTARSGAADPERQRAMDPPPASSSDIRPRTARLGPPPSRPSRAAPRPVIDPTAPPAGPDAEPTEATPRRVERGG